MASCSPGIDFSEELAQPRYRGQKDTYMIEKVRQDGEKSLLLHHFLHQPQVHMLTTTLHHKYMSQIQKFHRFQAHSLVWLAFLPLRLLKRICSDFQSFLEKGTNECNLRVPGIVRVFSDRFSKWCDVQLPRTLLCCSTEIQYLVCSQKPIHIAEEESWVTVHTVSEGWLLQQDASLHHLLSH